MGAPAGHPDFLTVDAFTRPPGAGRFSMDSEIVRVKIDSESDCDHWARLEAKR